MATLTPNEIPRHPIVGDRVIYGHGTSLDAWQAWQPLFDLPIVDVKNAFAPDKRVCIFAPHPDDEILGCGGLMQVLAANGNDIVLISVTNGTQSHPDSSHYSQERLNQIRPQETQNALKVLGLEKKVRHQLLDLPDGDVYQNRQKFVEKLKDFIAPNDCLVTVFEHDGHPDHEATGQVVSDFAKTHHMPCYQVLIWAWHWASPNDPRIDWQHLARLALTDAQTHKKRQALACFTSQILADPTTGQPPVLPDYAIERLLGIGEVFLQKTLEKKEPHVAT